MTIFDMIKTESFQTDATDDLWVRYIRDHKFIIIKNSKTYHISLSLADAVRHNLTQFLRSQGIPIHLDWIVRYINDIPTDIEFINVVSLYVPTYDYINSLYSFYRTSSNTMK